MIILSLLYCKQNLPRSQQCNNQSWSLFRWQMASKDIQINNMIILSLFYCKQNLPRIQECNNQSWSLFRSGQQRNTGWFFLTPPSPLVQYQNDRRTMSQPILIFVQIRPAKKNKGMVDLGKIKELGQLELLVHPGKLLVGSNKCFFAILQIGRETKQRPLSASPFLMANARSNKDFPYDGLLHLQKRLWQICLRFYIYLESRLY